MTNSEQGYEAVEVAKATGKLRKGSNEATKALEKGQAKLVVIADDVSPKEVVMHLPILAQEKGVLCINVPSKEELGAAAGLSVATTAIVIVQEGDAKKLIAEMNKNSKKAETKEEAPVEEAKEKVAEEKAEEAPVKESPVKKEETHVEKVAEEAPTEEAKEKVAEEETEEKSE